MKEHTEVIEAGIKALVRNADRLGITWALDYGTTVDSITSASSFTVIKDGDDSLTPIGAVSLIGIVPDGSRVALMTLPGGSIYVIGFLGFNALPNCDGTPLTAFSAGTTVTSIYADAPTGPFSFTKLSPLSRLKVEMHWNVFSATSGNTRAQLGVTCDGGTTDNTVVDIFLTSAADVQSASGTTYISGVPAGVITIQPRWRRVNGAGTVTLSSTEAYFLSVCEVQ